MSGNEELYRGNGLSQAVSEGGAFACLAVSRGTQHAAKHVSNDALMFDLVCAGLRGAGWNVDLVPENDLAAVLEKGKVFDGIISMAQRPENVALLSKLQAQGMRIVNPPYAVTNCYRTRLVQILQDSEVPVGRSVILQADTPEEYARVVEGIGSPFWLKRGDIHAAHRNDVRRIESEEEYAEGMADYRERGIPTVVGQEHLPGDVVKFYAVRRTSSASGSELTFFHAQYFESEEDVAFDTAPLERIADAAAALLELTIFGGDVVMTSAGPILIDLNAWPSFGRVRERAAPKMVEAITSGVVVQ